MKKFFKKLAGVVTAVAVGACISGCDCGNSKYTITLDYGTGKGTIQVEHGHQFTVEEGNYTRPGYIFAGWYSDNEYKNPYDFDKAVKSNITLYAKWVKYSAVNIPTTDLISNGYTVTMQEATADGYLVEGETATFQLTLHPDFIRDSSPVMKVNNTEISSISEEVVNNKKVYTYEYTSTGEDINVTVSGISIEKYSITLPALEGVTIKSVSGYNNTSINKYQEYKFRLVAKTGYNISEAVVTNNGITLTPSNGVYTISNISSNDNNIQVDNVYKYTYRVSYYEDNTAIDNGIGQRVKISNATKIVVYGEDIEFNIQINNAQYSDVIDNIADYLTITAGGKVIDDFTITDVEDTLMKKVTIAGKYVTDTINIVVNANDFAVNMLELTLPDTSLAVEGYELYLANIQPNEEGKYIVPYNTVAQVCIRIAEDSLEAAKNASVHVVANVGGSDSDVREYTIVGNDTTPEAVNFTIRSNTEFKVNSTFRIIRKSTPGVSYVSVDDYSDETNCFGNGARTYKFGLRIDTDAYDISNMSVEYYTNDSSNTVVINEVDGIYTISNIVDDINIVVKNVVEKKFTIALPVDLAGVDNMEVVQVGGEPVSEFSHFDTILIAVTIAESHDYYLDAIALGLSDKANVKRVSTEGNVITFEVKDLADSISASDVQLTGLVVDKYTITLPKLSDRINYQLTDIEGNILTNTEYTYEHGEELQIKIVPSERYNEDVDYDIIINGNIIEGDSNYLIKVDSVTEALNINVEGIDEVNAYSVKYYGYDGKTEIIFTQEDCVKSIKHGQALSIPNVQLQTQDHYEFDGWYYGVETANGYEKGKKFVDGDVVTGNVVLVASEVAIAYTITIDNTYHTQTFTWNDVSDGKTIALNDIAMERDGYTFDYFALMEDVVVEDITYPAGTKIESIGEEMLADISLESVWKITVGNSNSNNYRKLADAVRYAVAGDKIELTSDISSEDNRIKIDKSLTIVSRGDSKCTIEMNSINLVSYDYQSLLFIEGLGKNLIDVDISNVNFRFASSSILNQATTLLANNCNLTLNNVTIDSEAGALVYKASEKNKLVINNCDIVVNNDSNKGVVDRDFGIIIETNGNNVNVDIIDSSIMANLSSEEFKGVHVTNSIYTPNVNLENVKFVSGDSGIENYSTAIYLDSVANIEVTGCEVNNDDNMHWTYFIYRSYVTTIASEDKYSELEAEHAYVEELIANNTLNLVTASVHTFNVYSNTLVYKISIDESETMSHLIEFSNQGQLINYVNYGANMRYIGAGTIILSSQLTISEDQYIDFNNASLDCEANILINGSMLNLGNYLDINEGVTIENNGTIINEGTTVTVYGYGQLINGDDSSFVSHLLIVMPEARFENNGIMYCDIVNNYGNIVNNDDMSVGITLTNDGELLVGESGDVDVSYNLINNETINISGKLTARTNLYNNEKILITSLGKLTLNSLNYTNKGNVEIMTGGKIIDNAEGKITLGTYNDYGINNDIQMQTVNNTIQLLGNANEVASDAEVREFYPTGSGYYVGLTSYAGLGNANKAVNITYTRTDDAEYQYTYVTKNVTDTVDEFGRLEFIIDLNVVDDTRHLSALTINVTSEDGSIDYTHNLAFYMGTEDKTPIMQGTINEYGLENDIRITTINEASSTYNIAGNVAKVDEDAVVNTLFGNGTGYYIGFIINAGKANRNRDMLIDITRTEVDGVVYQYASKLACPDKANDRGWLEMLIDLNAYTNDDGILTRGLNNVTIRVYNSDQSLEGAIDVTYSIDVRCALVDAIDTGIRSINIGSINDYGIDNSNIYLDSYRDYTGMSYIATGSVAKVSEEAYVNQLYTNGSGYYINFVIDLGKSFANSDVEIKYTRTEKVGYTYQYVTKKATDVTDNDGLLELIVDLNGKDNEIGIDTITIEVKSGEEVNTYTIYLGGVNLI